MFARIVTGDKRSDPPETSEGTQFMASNGIIEVTDANFDQAVLKSDQLVLIDFWATWCGPCKALSPIVDEGAAAYAGRVTGAKMDVDSCPATPHLDAWRQIPP